ncbi:MAG: radical SAM protein [Lachnospiraceae bacterium]|jgi:uncharacterized protein|nr:radical SAM protein [Lachnospiraceae bacterium]
MEIKEKNINLFELFQTVNGKYLYDTNKDKLIEISNDLYLYLKKKINSLSKDTAEEVKELKRKGYLKSNPVESIVHPMSQYLPLYQKRNLSAITLQVTQNCNLRCKYCVYTVESNGNQRVHSAKKMTWETAKAAIDFLWIHSVDSDIISIGFYGGEPFLEKELVEKCILYSRKKFEGKKLQFQLTTNATLLDRECLAFMFENNMHIMLSLDGPREIHDRNRVFAANGKGTYDTVIQKLKLIKKEFPQYINQVSVNMVMDTKNDFSQIKKLTDVGGELEGISTQASFIVNEYVDVEEEMPLLFWQDYQYELFLVYMFLLGRVEETDIAVVLRNYRESLKNLQELMSVTGELRPITGPGGPCIPGKRFMVDVDGIFYPCERVSETAACTKIGSIENGFDIIKSQRILNISQINEERCKNCWAFRHCKTCIRSCTGDQGISVKKMVQECKRIQEDIYENMRAILFLKEIEERYET